YRMSGNAIAPPGAVLWGEPVPMPRYYFDVFGVNGEFADLEGLDLPDSAAAAHEAAGAALAAAWNANSLIATVEVRDHTGPVVAATVALKVEDLRETSISAAKRMTAWH